MAVIKTKAGGEHTIGDYSSTGYPFLTSWGDAPRVVDPGVPLSRVGKNPTDPVKLWRTQPSIRKVVEFAARQFASIPWHAYQRVSDTDRVRVAGSRAEQLMTLPRPNQPLMSGYQFWQAMATDRMVYDLALAVYTEEDGLVRIPPGLVEIKSDHWGQPVRVLLAAPEGQDPLDVTGAPKIFSYGWHPGRAGGISVMHTLADILNENLRAVAWRASQWENSPKISGILTRPESSRKWDPKHRERFQQEWAAWRDGGKAGGTPILEGGMDYKELQGLSPKDARDVEGRQLTDAEVASALHIPPELVGARVSNFASIDAFRQMLFGPTLGPLFVEFEQAVKIGGVIQAVDSRDGIYLEPYREAGMAGSFMEQARIMQTMTGGPVLTRAEGRARLNLPYIDGTDELIVPKNVTEGGLASPTDTGDQNLGGDNARLREEGR